MTETQAENEKRTAVEAALRESVETVERAQIPYVLIGGLASTILGRPRFTEDIDFLVARGDAKRMLEALGEAGFEAEETNPDWIFKARKHDVTVDVIFALMGGIYLDDEMLARAARREFGGIEVTVVPPEDLIVIKAVVHDEFTPRHWYDALGIIATCELDWDYLATRARHGARRVLSLLIYAQSNDLVVTDETIQALYAGIYGGDAGVS
jgi:predicted nucleotidyltransferase